MSMMHSQLLATLAVFAALAAVALATHCRPGTTLFDRKCYGVYRPSSKCSRDFNQTEAEAFCQANNGTLAAVRNETLHNFLTHLIKKGQKAKQKACNSQCAENKPSACSCRDAYRDYFYWIGMELTHLANGSVSGASWTDGSDVTYGNPLCECSPFRPPFAPGRPIGSPGDGSDPNEVCPGGNQNNCVQMYGFGDAIGRWRDQECGNNHVLERTCSCNATVGSNSTVPSQEHKRPPSSSSSEEEQIVVDECRDEAALNGAICQYRQGCLDLHYECAGWARLGQCTAPNRQQFMSENCPVSCSLCKEECEDYDSPAECRIRAEAGDCTSDPEHMLVRCKKTCQYCDRCTNLHTACPYQAASCASTDVAVATQLDFYCRATCQRCVPVSTCEIPDPTLGKCPRDWLYSPAANKCIWGTPHRGQYAAVQATCVANNGTLVSIHSPTENAFFGLLPAPPVSAGAYFYFIGFIRGAGGWGNPHWQDGSAVDYVNWIVGQPDSGINENYGVIVLNGGNPPNGWHDVIDKPEEQYPGFCQMPVCAATPP